MAPKIPMGGSRKPGPRRNQASAIATGAHFWLYLAPLVAYVLVISYSNIRGLDLWWHIKTGEWIVLHKAIPFADPFSYTAAGKPWVSHEWLFGLFSYAIYALGGVKGIVVTKAVLVALTIALVAWIARVRGAAAGMTLLVLTASYAIARARFTERPELLSLPLAAGFLLVYEKSRSRPAWLGLLPVLQLLWVNSHGGTAILGCALAGVLLFDRAREIRSATGAWNLRDRTLSRCAAACGGVIAASFVNPHGHRALFYGMLRTQSPIDNREFQSFLTLAGKGIDLTIALTLCFVVLLALCFALHPPRVRTYEWLLFPLLLTVTVVFFRFRPLFVFLMAPSLAWHLGQWNLPLRSRSWFPALLAVAIMVRVAVVENGTYFYRFGPGVHPGVFPVRAAQFLDAHAVSGNMFNSYGLGGYLIWSRKVFIDGREDVYLGPGVLSEYVHAFDSAGSWQALADKYAVDFAIVQYPESPPATASRSLDTLAFPRSHWGLIYFDDVAAIYVRRNGRNDKALRREITTVQPFQLSGYLDSVVADPVKLKVIRSELAENARENPASFRNRFTAGLLALKLGKEYVSEALRNFEEAAALNPDFVPAHLNAGSIYLRLGRRGDAEAAFRRALSIEDNPFAREQLEAARRSAAR